jgi:hypothetical protein
MSNITFREMRDFSEYKYKYFTNLEAFNVDEGLEAFKNPRIYQAVCVKECPDNIGFKEIAEGGRIDCLTNEDVKTCPEYSASVFMNTTRRLTYCIPKTDKAEAILKEMYAELDESVGGFGNYINDIK